MNIDWGFAGAVVLVGLVVVFAVLIILVLVCVISGKIFTAIDKSKKNGGKKEDEKKSDVPAKKNVQSNSELSVEAGISDDIIAAITAAISCVMGKGTFALKSVRRSKGARPVWNATGIAENTRPF